MFTQNKFVAPPVVLAARRLADERRAGRGDHRQFSGNANAGTGARRPRRRRGDGGGRGGGARASPRPTCWSARPGSSARRCRWTRSSRPRPSSAKKLSVEGGADAAHGHPHHRPQGQGSGGRRLDLHARRHGQGLRHDRAQHGDDARLPHHRRRRRRAEMLQRSFATPSDRTFNTLNVDGATSTNDTVILLASGRRGRPDIARVRRRRAPGLRGPDAADGARRRGHDQDGRACASPAPRATPRRATAAKSIAENNLVKCSWYGGDPYWGRLLAAAGSAGHRLRDRRSATVAYGGIDRLARRRTDRDHDEAAVAAHMKRRARSRSRSRSASARARRR